MEKPLIVTKKLISEQKRMLAVCPFLFLLIMIPVMFQCRTVSAAEVTHPGKTPGASENVKHLPGTAIPFFAGTILSVQV